MAIVEEDIERVRSAVSLVDVVSARTCSSSGWDATTSGLCPFHAERTGSFNVRDEVGPLPLLRLRRVRRRLPLRAGDGAPRLRRRGRAAGGQGRGHAALHERRRGPRPAAAQGAAGGHGDRRRLVPPAAPQRAGRPRRRATTCAAGASTARWRAGSGWDGRRTTGMRWPAGSALPERVLRDTGLAFVNRRDRLQDTFRARLLFPIFNETGEPVAFGGRVLPGSADPAKYKNSPETSIYSKSKVLYGLNWAKSDIVKADRVVVCEGYTDVIGFHRVGVPIAVATCGTALTADHVRLLKRFANRVVLAFDADAAGQGAAERFYEWERQFDVTVEVARLPRGKDPGELAGEDRRRAAACGRGRGAVPGIPRRPGAARRWSRRHAGGQGQAGQRGHGRRQRAPRRQRAQALRRPGGAAHRTAGRRPREGGRAARAGGRGARRPGPPGADGRTPSSWCWRC